MFHLIALVLVVALGIWVVLCLAGMVMLFRERRAAINFERAQRWRTVGPYVDYK